MFWDWIAVLQMPHRALRRLDLNNSWQHHTEVTCPSLRVLKQIIQTLRILSESPKALKSNVKQLYNAKTQKKRHHRHIHTPTYLWCVQSSGQAHNTHTKTERDNIDKRKIQTHVGCLVKRSRSAAFSLAVLGNTLSLATSDISLISRTQFPSDSSVLA